MRSQRLASKASTNERLRNSKRVVLCGDIYMFGSQLSLICFPLNPKFLREWM